MRSRLSSFTMALTLVIAAVGCGSDSGSNNDGGTGGTGGNQPLDVRACTELGQVYCKRISDCSGGRAIESGYLDIKDCEARERDICLASARRTGSGNTAERQLTCRKMEAARACRGFAGFSIPECDRSMGSFEPGQPCVSSNQCKSQACDIPTGLACGTCPMPKAEIGGPCMASADCRGGLYCKRAAGSPDPGMCSEFLKVGDMCDGVASPAELRCGGGMECAKPAGSATGNCVARDGQVGATCDNRMTWCGSGLNCVGLVTMQGMVVTPGKCTEPVATEGAACSTSSNGPQPTCDGNRGFTCEITDMVAMTGTCKQRLLAGKGEACGDAPMPACKNGRTCTNGVCTDRSPAGGPCSTDTKLGPGCTPTLQACVPTISGTSDGTCQARSYEQLCMLAPAM